MIQCNWQESNLPVGTSSGFPIAEASVAARSPSVRWGHRKLCPVAKLDNVACGNRTRLTITVSPHYHALPQLYHHCGSEEKRGVSGFSPLAQYHNKAEKQLKGLTKVSSRFQPTDKSQRMRLALLVLFDNTGLLIKTACPLFAGHCIVWSSKNLLV
ncbi:hypothetical protein MLCA_00050 [Lactobacillus phage MLC-A]|nr:hypothetical protein MLCA_00050 [Lactobacillus phage MLC-A]